MYGLREVRGVRGEPNISSARKSERIFRVGILCRSLKSLRQSPPKRYEFFWAANLTTADYVPGDVKWKTPLRQQRKKHFSLCIRDRLFGKLFLGGSHYFYFYPVCTICTERSMATVTQVACILFRSSIFFFLSAGSDSNAKQKIMRSEYSVMESANISFFFCR